MDLVDKSCEGNPNFGRVWTEHMVEVIESFDLSESPQYGTKFDVHEALESCKVGIASLSIALQLFQRLSNLAFCAYTTYLQGPSFFERSEKVRTKTPYSNVFYLR